MPNQAPTTDNLLLPLLCAEAEEAKLLIEHLVTAHAEPLIKRVIKSKLHLSHESGAGQDAEDLQSEVLVQLLIRLRAFRSDPAQQTISNFRGYVAVVTYRACYNHLRQKYPHYHQLKNRLRYLLTHRPEFALWENEQEVWLCGFARWKTTQHAELGTARIQQIIDDPQNFERVTLGGRGADQVSLVQLLTSLFGWVGQPVELDQLAGLIARLQGLNFQPLFIESDEESDSCPFESLFDQRANPAAEAEARQQLRQLWSEIKELSLKQRTALLLNLRDTNGGNAVALLPHTGTATLRQIADALAMQAVELAELWPRLPLNDDAIARRLGLTRQQVINLRLAARRRLARRMNIYGQLVWSA